MPVNPVYPGVYVEEIPSGSHDIAGVPTSVAAFVGSFERGPLDTAILITDTNMFDQIFGQPISETYHAVHQFFHNGGKTAYVVRVASTSLASAISPLHDAFGKHLATLTAGQQVRGKTAYNPGAWGNKIRFEVSYATSSSDTLFALRVKEVDISDQKTRVLRNELHSDLNFKPGSANNAVFRVNAASDLVQLSPNFARPDARDQPRVTGTLGGNLPEQVPSLEKLEGLQVSLLFGDTNIKDIGPVAIDFSDAKQPDSHTAWTSLFRKRLRASARQLPKPLKPYLKRASVKLLGDGTDKNPYRFHISCGRNGRPFLPATEIQFSSETGHVEAMFGLAKQGASPKSGSEVLQQGPQQFVLTDGLDGSETSTTSLIGDPASQTGIYALEAVETFNILCLPELSSYPGDEARSAYARALAYVTERRAMLIVDPPASVNTVNAMQDWMGDSSILQAPNAAVYFPRIRIHDGSSGSFDLAASATIAGLMALTDETRGVWKAPAGVDAQLIGIDVLTLDMTDAENEVLNGLGVNALRNMAAQGPVSWGARTMAGSDQSMSEWKYVPVRRTMLFIEHSLQRGTQWVVFEPNDEPLWAQIRETVKAFMVKVYSLGALQGTSPDDAFFVKCDRTTMTQADIDQGIINIIVGIAPLRPAEFITIRIRQVARPPE